MDLPCARGCMNPGREQALSFTEHGVYAVVRLFIIVMLATGRLFACTVRQLTAHCATAELFDVLSAAAAAEHPGQALLRAGRAARWPILAVLAACYDDASALSCMAVWLDCSLHRCCADGAGPCKQRYPRICG